MNFEQIKKDIEQMDLEKFKKEFNEILAGMSYKELQADLIMRGAKLMRIHEDRENIMNDNERALEEIKQLAFDTISDLYFEGKMTREDWDDATDKIEEYNTEKELAALVRQIENYSNSIH
jgi:putative heme iron utilization protein